MQRDPIFERLLETEAEYVRLLAVEHARETALLYASNDTNAIFTRLLAEVRAQLDALRLP